MDLIESYIVAARDGSASVVTSLLSDALSAHESGRTARCEELLREARERAGHAVHDVQMCLDAMARAGR